MKVYHWDFFGPSAQRTAEHFRKHLDAFLVENALKGCQTGLGSEGRGHLGVWCRAPDEAAGPIVATLKPRRATLAEE